MKILGPGLAVLVVALLALSLLLVKAPAGRSGGPDRGNPSGRDRFRISGVSYTSAPGPRGMEFTLKAKELIQQSRKVGPLTLGPVQEITITDLDLTVQLPGPRAGDSGAPDTLDLPVRSFIDQALASRQLEFISRIRVHGLRAHLVVSGTERLTIEGQTALLQGPSSPIRLEGRFILQSALGQRLEARAGLWEAPGMRFRVPGPYLFHDLERTRPGRNQVFTLSPAGRITPAPLPAREGRTPRRSDP